jgi:hypothetical protein
MNSKNSSFKKWNFFKIINQCNLFKKAIDFNQGYWKAINSKDRINRLLDKDNHLLCLNRNSSLEFKSFKQKYHSIGAIIKRKNIMCFKNKLRNKYLKSLMDLLKDFMEKNYKQREVYLMKRKLIMNLNLLLQFTWNLISHCRMWAQLDNLGF